MSDNWVLNNDAVITPEQIFSTVMSFLGCNGDTGAQAQFAERCRGAALDCINAAIQEVNRINREFSPNDITPSAVTAFDTQITAASVVAYSVLPLKTAVLVALRYDPKTAQILDKMYQTAFALYRSSAPAVAEPIKEVY